MNIPGFESAQRAYENMEPPTGVEQCEGGYCGHCAECLAAEAQDEADDYAEAQREDARIESRWGA
jgi:hypothetical protein